MNIQDKHQSIAREFAKKVPEKHDQRVNTI